MSVTDQGIGVREATPGRGWAQRLDVIRIARAHSLTLWAFVGSRLLVLLAGVGGVLTVQRQAGWRMFDPVGVTMHLGTLGNLLAGSAVRWDAVHYLTIAHHGYAATEAASPSFFPLYPTLIRAVGYLTGSDAVAGVAISMTSFAVALVLLRRLTELELGRRAAEATVLLIAFAPLSFFFSAIYTESLFLALSVGAVLAARRERWALAGLLAALATLTRATGILLVVPLVIMKLRTARGLDRRLAWVLLVPGALMAYVGWLAANGFALLAPFHDELFWHRRAVGPLGGIALGVRAAVRSAGEIARGIHPIYDPTRFGPLTPSAESIFLLLGLAIAAAFLVACFRRLPLAYGAYAALALMMCVSSPVFGQPLVSVDRYVLTIFPLWMAAGAWLARRRIAPAVIAIGAALLTFYTVWFSSWSFIA